MVWSPVKNSPDPQWKKDKKKKKEKKGNEKMSHGVLQSQPVHAIISFLRLLLLLLFLESPEPTPPLI